MYDEIKSNMWGIQGHVKNPIMCALYTNLDSEVRVENLIFVC